MSNESFTEPNTSEWLLNQHLTHLLNTHDIVATKKNWKFFVLICLCKVEL